LLLVGKYQQNGLAAASTISYFFYFLFGGAIVINKLHFKKMNLVSSAFLISCANAGLSFIVVELLFRYLLPGGIAISVLKITFFFIIYLVNALLIKDETIAIAKDLFIKAGEFLFA